MHCLFVYSCQYISPSNAHCGKVMMTLQVRAGLQGREQEITLSDLHHVAEEEQKAWFDETSSRQVVLP